MRVILFKIFEDKELLLLLSHKEKDLFNFKNYIERYIKDFRIDNFFYNFNRFYFAFQIKIERN